jgi:1-acyl-sn-glycerol-3-phosphate acyltransferase
VAEQDAAIEDETESKVVETTLRGRAARPPARAEQHQHEAHPPARGTYLLSRLLGTLLFGVCVGARVTGLENVPDEGPLLVVANHLSYLEPPLLATILPRRITFVAAHELWGISWLRGLLRLMQVLPVRRGGAGDVDAIRTALALLGQGEAVAVFPEGRVSTTGALQRGKPGISLLAQRSGTPILPVGISGTERLGTPWPFLTARWRKPRVRVSIGPVIRLEYGPGRADHQAMADLVMQALAAQLPAEYRGEYRA